MAYVLEVGLVLLALVGCGGSKQPKPERTVRSYLAALDAGDAEEALSHLGSGFTMRDWSGSVLATRHQYAEMIGWDHVAEGTRTVERLEVSDETVTVTMSEENAFTELLDLDPFQLECHFTVDGGKITELRFRERVGADEATHSEAFLDAIAPVLAWAERDGLVAAVAAADGGVMRYDAESARTLLSLIRAYGAREETR